MQNKNVDKKEIIQVIVINNSVVLQIELKTYNRAKILIT